jgi:hypothetical protein
MPKQIERKRVQGRSGGKERGRERSGVHSIKKMANNFFCLNLSWFGHRYKGDPLTSFIII